MSQGIQATSNSWKLQGNGFSSRASRKKHSTVTTLSLAQYTMSDFWPPEVECWISAPHLLFHCSSYSIFLFIHSFILSLFNFIFSIVPFSFLFLSTLSPSLYPLPFSTPTFLPHFSMLVSQSLCFPLSTFYLKTFTGLLDQLNYCKSIPIYGGGRDWK